IESRR
ncbi:bacterial regulatory helix-turn-helix, lysR family protein, partial [Vibrio parahaemolyticus VPTS-2010]